MDAESKQVLEYLTEIEEAAEDVLSTKQQVTKFLIYIFKYSTRSPGRISGSRQISHGSIWDILAGKLTSLVVDSW